MRTEEQLQKIHDEMQIMLFDTINSGLKFEVCVSMGKQIIRANYHTVDIEVFRSRLPRDAHEGIITLMVDPSSTSKKVYLQIIENIFRANNLKTVMKDSPNFKKEQKLILLIEINYLHHYCDKSQIQISEYLAEHNIAGAKDIDTNLFSKDAHRYIQMAMAIKNISDITSSDSFLI